MRKRDIFWEQIYPALLVILGWIILPQGFGERLVTMGWTDMWQMVNDLSAAAMVAGLSVWISSVVRYHPYIERMMNKNDNEED